MPDPTLAVSLLKPEEAEQYMRIRHTAFKHDINKILYFNQVEPSQATLNRVSKDIVDGIAKGIFYLKCVDTSTNEIVAGARWRHVRPKDPNATIRTSEEVEKDLTVPEPYSESHLEIWHTLYELFNESKRSRLGNRPYWALDTLVTHPNHHRRGAGGLLLTWGCSRADETGTEAYLEASLMGEPLYKRYGFEPVGDLELDLRKWGGDEKIEWTAMIRPARAPESRDTAISKHGK